MLYGLDAPLSNFTTLSFTVTVSFRNRCTWEQFIYCSLANKGAFIKLRKLYIYIKIHIIIAPNFNINLNFCKLNESEFVGEWTMYRFNNARCNDKNLGTIVQQTNGNSCFNFLLCAHQNISNNIPAWEARKNCIYSEFQNKNLEFWFVFHYTVNTISNKLTPSSTVLLEKLIVHQQVKKFSASCRNRLFITVFTTSCLRFLSWITWIPLTIRSNITLLSTTISSTRSLSFV